MRSAYCLLVLAILLQSACSTIPAEPDPAYAAVRPAYSEPLPVADGAIYRVGYGISLFDDRKARRVGDIITVLLSESTQASKSANTSVAKDSKLDLGTPSLYGGPVTHIGRDVLAATADASRSFSGGGDATQSNSIAGTIGVSVVEVLANGNLVIRGEKLLTLNQGSERVQVSGIIREADVTPDNTVMSTQIADARIAYIGEGALSDANTMGWVSRFFNSGWWPF